MWQDKVRAFFLELYPELGKFKLFEEIREKLIPVLNPYLKKILRFGIPTFTVFFVVTLGLLIGNRLSSLQKSKEVLPPSINLVTPPSSEVFQSQFLPVKQAIETFSLNLPDPVPPVVDYKISLETIDDDYRF